MYRACALNGVPPRVADELELWEIAAVIGGNEPPSGESEGEREFNLNERPDPEGPSVFAAWRALRGSEGKPIPSFGDKISPAEHARVLRLIEGGKKGTG